MLSAFCSDRSGILTEGTSSSSLKGIVSFQYLRASCYPTGYLNIQYFANIEDSTSFGLSKDAYAIDSDGVMSFRDCYSGEILVGADCSECPEAFYLLEYTPGASTCKSCPEEGDFCKGDAINLTAGYWRRTPESEAIYKCPTGQAGCKGGGMTGQSTCNKGYEGVKCSQCSTGYYYNSDAAIYFLNVSM